jgi:hypothetical protein
LSESLAVADSVGSDFFSSLPPAGQWEVILLPRDPRLYYIQANLFPKTTWGTVGADAKLYLDYWYTRGDDLYFPGDTYH